MSAALVAVSAWILAQAATPAPAKPPLDASVANEPPPPLEEEAPPPPPPAPAEPLTYGYKGMSEPSLALGYSSASGFVGGDGFATSS